MRSSAALLGVLALVLAVPHSPAAQEPYIEPDAPERRVAGCYALAVAGELRALSPDSVFLPDTIHLTLRAAHVGITYQAPSWREAGWKLTISPDPFSGFHSFGSWSLPAVGVLAVRWSGPYGGQVLALRKGGAGWEGTLTLTWPNDRERTVGATLRPVPCPGEEYFRTVVSEAWRRHMR